MYGVCCWASKESADRIAVLCLCPFCWWCCCCDNLLWWFVELSLASHSINRLIAILSWLSLPTDLLKFLVTANNFQGLISIKGSFLNYMYVYTTSHPWDAWADFGSVVSLLCHSQWSMVEYKHTEADCRLEEISWMSCDCWSEAILV